jgi:hypothetical protein
VSCLSTVTAFAQPSSDEAGYRQLLTGLGKTLYFFAWPTDTYDHMEFGHIERRPGGADVYVVLYGNSWLEGNLWTEVVTEIRNGSVSDMRFGRYSSKALIKPGSTIQAWGEVLVELNQELKRQQARQNNLSSPAQPSPSENALSAICVKNPTDDAITYALPSEQMSSKTLAPGQVWMYWHEGPGLFTISFNGMKAANFPWTVHMKGVMRSSRPDSCDDRMIYEFVVDGGRISIAPRTWVPGSEAPFIPNLYRASGEGKWVCAAGYKWASSDPNSTDCVPADTGLIGITLNIDPATPYPLITTVSPDGSAALAGVPAGSHLIEVNGSSMVGLDLNAVVAQTRGRTNTMVRIGVQPPGSDRIEYFDLRRQ